MMRIGITPRIIGIAFCAVTILGAAMPAMADDPVCGERGEIVRDIPRPITGIYSLEAGRRSVVSRYLAPVSYSGGEYALAGRWIKAMPFNPEMALMEFDARVDGAWSLLNPRKNSSMQAIDAEFDWNMRAWWSLPHDFTISVGGGIELEGGALALLKNSNNPVSVNIAAAAGVAASGSWTHTFGRLPIVATLGLRAPLLGAFYMPGYGETYFEMYVGNHSGLVHCGWPGNRQKINMNLSVILDFGKTSMEVGYHLNFQRAEANRLIYRSFSNCFTIGVIPGGTGLRRHQAQIRPF